MGRKSARSRETNQEDWPGEEEFLREEDPEGWGEEQPDEKASARVEEKMRQILDYVDMYYDRYNECPTIRNIEAHTGISRAMVQRYLVRMDRRGTIEYSGKDIMTPKRLKLVGEYTTAGIIGTIPCGPLEMEEENLEEYVRLPTRIFGEGPFYLLHAQGDSMTGAGIDDGDLLVIRQQEDANSGDIVVAYVPGEGNTLKTLKFQKGRVVLHPENEDYEDIRPKTCRIQGKLVRIIKEPHPGR